MVVGICVCKVTEMGHIHNGLSEMAMNTVMQNSSGSLLYQHFSFWTVPLENWATHTLGQLCVVCVICPLKKLF